MPRSANKHYVSVGLPENHPIVKHLQEEAESVGKTLGEYVTDLLLQRDGSLYNAKPGVADGWYPRDKVLLDLSNLPALMAALGGVVPPSQEPEAQSTLAFDTDKALAQADDVLDFL